MRFLRLACAAAVLMAAGCRTPAVTAPPRNASLLFDRVPSGISASFFGRKPWPTASQADDYDVRERLHIHEYLGAGGYGDGFSYHRDYYATRRRP